MYLISEGVMSDERAKDIVQIISDNLVGVATVEHNLPMLFKDSNVPDYELILAKIHFEDANAVIDKTGAINDALDEKYGIALLYPVKVTNPDELDTSGEFRLVDDDELHGGLFEEEES